MPFAYNKKLVGNAQYLRNNMTDEEKQLWYHFLKRLPVTVRRQKNIGNYIVDFYISSAKIVIEIDGSQHKSPQNKEKDAIRDNYLNSLGIYVLRYSNKAINQNFLDVCNDILKHLNLSRVTRIIRTSFLATNIRHQFFKSLDSINILSSAFACC